WRCSACRGRGFRPHPARRSRDLCANGRLGRGGGRRLHQVVRHESDTVGEGESVVSTQDSGRMLRDPALLEVTLEHLRALVGFDTRNPPRHIDAGGIFDYLRAQLPDFVITVTDHGAGAVSMLAVRGKPRFLFNVHLDTVPAAPTWSRDPHQLLVTNERAIGL